VSFLLKKQILIAEVDMKTQIRRRLGTSCMVLSALVLFAVSACATYSNAADLNLTYIGEAHGPDASLTYFLQGPAQGETVVLLPGMGRGADEFRELAADLNKAGYRTVAIQPRGIGRSGPILTDPTYEKFADDVALVLSDIPGGISGGRAHVLGYEFGNRVARMFAVRYPKRVGSLVLLACGGQQVSASSSSTKASKTTKSGPGAAKSAPKGQSPGASTKKVPSAKALAAHPSALTEKIDSYFRDLAAKSAKTDPQDVTLSGMTAAFAFWLTPSVREHFVKHAFFAPMSKVPYYWITGWYRDTGWMQQAMDQDHSSTSADWVSGGSAPMLILNGQYDVAAPVANATYMKKTYPDRVTMFTVPDAGHAMLAEQPAFISDHMISYLGQHPIIR
jgi:pimeloyl-ACP methyl ester carboxylesterase